MDLGINGRVALVLGAGGGLGGAIAHQLAAEGASVAACDISPESLTDLVEENPRTTPFTFDLRDLNSIDSVVEQIESQLGHVEILVNITGGPPATTATGIASPEWDKHFHAMVTPIIHLTDRVLPNMRQSKWGRIITSTSSGVVAPIPNLGISNALRSTLLGWSKSLAFEVGSDGVTVNTIVPGRIATARIRQLDQARAQREGRSVSDVAARSQESIPIGRYGTPAEYADVVAFLSSERASYITGSMLRVDGGMIPNV